MHKELKGKPLFTVKFSSWAHALLLWYLWQKPNNRK